MVPLLQQLYMASSRAPSRLYMLLIVILILSQDPGLAHNLHEVVVPAVPWFKERLLQKTSLGKHTALLLVLALYCTSTCQAGVVWCSADDTD